MADANQHLAEEVAGLRASVAELAGVVAKIPETVKATIEEMFPALEDGGPPAHDHTAVEG